ncbi:hypothetical protein niasHT_031212 [Heterodera trifolii]|uniref:Uncharacterized protein n=1 Tax=Heterodera trifolii TaxID=157864 RepID=A0ABD2IYD5_9BILA
MSVIKKIDKDSVEGLEGSLSLFSLPPTNVAINKTNVRELLPLSALNQTGPYLFRLFSDSQYCDLSKTYMYLLSSIERKNDAGEWVALSDTDANDKHVGVIQNFGSSFVRSLKVNISGIEVFDSSIYYHYRDYIMKELGYSQEIRKAFHEASCYYPDDDDQNSATNPGFTARAARFSGSKQCETMVKLNFDLARQNALMLNNQDVIFTIHRNNDSFLLLTPPYKKPDGTLQENKKEYRIRVHDMRLYVRTVDVTPSLTQRFGIRMGPGVMHVDLSKQLSYVLGFDHKTRIYKNQSAKYPPALSGGVRQLYVYAPKLVEDSIIGDRMAPLLRVVNVSGTPGLDMPETAFGRYVKFVMTHVVFNPDNVNWSAFLALQQQQEGSGELQYFVGNKFQRGGGLLQNISRFLMPVATNLLKSASKEGISAGTRMLDDLAQGKAFKESLKTQAKQGFENLAEKLNQCGKGGRQRYKAITHRKNNKTGTLRGKRQIIDQLTFAH